MARLTFLEKVEQHIYPSRQEFFHLFIEENKTYKELCDLLGVSVKIIKQLASLYDIHKSTDLVQENVKKINKEKYGVERPIVLTEVRNKNTNKRPFSEERKQRLREKDWTEAVAKRTETCLKKYGTETYSQTPECKEKVKETARKHFGVDNVSQNGEIKKKMVETCLAKYGTKYYSQSEQYKTRFSWNEDAAHYLSSGENLKEFFLQFNPKIRMQEAAELLGCSYTRLCDRVATWELHDYVDFHPRESSYEIELRKMFDDWGIKYIEHERKILLSGEIDLFFPEYKIGIEFNGSYWHNEGKKDRKYHQNKSLEAEANGVFLFHIFEYEWNDPRTKQAIIGQLENLFHINQTKIYARKTELKLITSSEEKNHFLELYHKQGRDHNSQVALGLYYQGELVSLMTFCTARFTKKQQWELSRFCSKRGCNVIGGASKLFRYFLDNYTGDIVSYSDIAKTRGNLYETLGFKMSHISDPSYVWYKSDRDVKTRYQTRIKNERETMTQQGYVRIFDSGVKTWVYQR